MFNNLLTRLLQLPKKLLWFLAVLLSLLLTEIVTSVMSIYFFGKVTQDYLITGVIASIFVATIVVSIVFFFLGKLSDLNQANQYLTAILDCCPVPMAINDRQNNVLMINPEFTRIFGYELSDIPTLADWWLKAYPNPEYREQIRSQWLERVSNLEADGSGFKQLEVKICCKNGAFKTVLVIASPINQVPIKVHLVVLFDISEPATALSALDESRALLKSIIETIPLRVFWKDRDSRYLGCNTAFAKDGGQQKATDIIGKLDNELGWKEQAQRYQMDDWAVMDNREAKLNYVEPQTTPDGRQIWLRTSKLPLENTQGDVIGVLGVYDDITQSIKTENELWLTKAIIDKSKTAFFRLSSKGQVEYVNEFTCRALGYSSEELIGMYPWQFDPDFSADQWSIVWDKLLKNGTINLESRYRRKDGFLFDVDITAHYIAFNGEEFSFTFAQDISDRRKAEQALRQKERYQRALIDNFPFEVWLKDPESRFLAVNKEFANTFGSGSADELIGKTDFDIASPELAEAYRADDRQVMNSRQQKMVEEIIPDQAGDKWVETFKAPVVDEVGDLLGTVGFFRDISARKLIETELRIAATAFESQEGMIITDADTIILKINQSFTQITGYHGEEVIGRKMKVLKSGVHDQPFYAHMWQTIEQTGSWQGEIWNRRKNGEIYPEWLTITAVKAIDGAVTHYVGTMIDVTARKAIESKLEYLAHHDPLTNLPNRLLLSDRLQLAIAQAHREQSRLGILYLDLDKFKPVNDNLGHEVGDQLLKEVAERIGRCVQRESDTISRLGGDEFVILLAPIDQQHDVLGVAEKILFILRQPFLIEQHTIHIACSIGIALYPADGIDSITLMRNADNAMYQAKNQGANCIHFYQHDQFSSG